MRPTLMLLLLAAPAAAHDFWLEAGSFSPKLGETVPLHLLVGDRFVREGQKQLQIKGTPRFESWHDDEHTDLLKAAMEGARPVAHVAFKKAGTALVVMDRAARLIKLEAKKFNQYLKEEGLDAVLADRRRAGEMMADGRERYARCLKLLARVGGKGDDGWKRVVGQRLEIVPLADPTGLAKGHRLPFRVLFVGKPLVGAQIVAHVRKGGKVATQRRTTNMKGEVTFTIDHGGIWLVRLVHMRRTTGDADWESVWGAMTFSLP